MKCERARELFSERIDDVLERTEAGRVDEHVAACEPCRTEWHGYRDSLAELDSYLHRRVAEQEPNRPFPQLERRPRLGALTHATLAAAALASLLLLSRTGGPVLRESVGHDHSMMSGLAVPAELCPWRDRRLVEVSEAVSYPVVTDECLEGFQLVQASVRAGEDCDENMRLTYRSGARQLVVEQRPEAAPGCCSGDHVLVGDHLGCVESRDDRTLLSWSQHHHVFELSGDVALAEVVQAAHLISQSFGE